MNCHFDSTGKCLRIKLYGLSQKYKSPNDFIKLSPMQPPEPQAESTR